MKQSSVVPSKYSLSNGLRVFVDSDSRFHTASVAICLLGGLRSETTEFVGVTHLLEHVLFKRTLTSSPLEIAKTIDLLGGAVNGFTDADSLCLHADVPANRIEEIVALFADMLLAPNFSDADFETEREVVRQEMLELIDDPADSAYRGFCEAFWQDSMLALPVCGTEESIARMNPALLKARLKETLVGARVVIGFAGGVDAEHCARIVERHFAHLPTGNHFVPDAPRFGNGLVTTTRPGSQVHFILGTPWPHLSHSEYTAAGAVISVLGEGMSSRLFQRLREERGLVYDIECSCEAFPDTAAFEIAGVVERSNFSEVLSIIQKEIVQLRREGVTKEELEHVQEVFQADVIMERDSLDAKMWRAIQSELLYGRYVTPEEDLEALREVQPQHCLAIVQEYLRPGSFVASFAGEVENLQIHEEIRRWCETVQ